MLHRVELSQTRSYHSTLKGGSQRGRKLLNELRGGPFTTEGESSIDAYSDPSSPGFWPACAFHQG